MPEELDQPPGARPAADVQTEAPAWKARWRRRLKLALVLILVVPILGFALYTWSSLHYSYAHGERVGYVQNFSQEGWLCKTWEGELAMVNLPGTTPQIFRFTVRDNAVAQRIRQTLGQRVSLGFDQHRGVPTSCFGDTEYYVTTVTVTKP